MRTFILSLLLFGGCASTAALENAQRNVEMCEYHERMERAAGDPRANATAASCAAWRGELAVQQTRYAERAERRRLRASTASAAPVSCSSTTLGSSTYTNCN